jgi:hypothetical protein
VPSARFVNRTRAIFRSAEFGFFGVVVFTLMQTPRRCGHFCKSGAVDLVMTFSLPLRINWLIVGMEAPPCFYQTPMGKITKLLQDSRDAGFHFDTARGAKPRHRIDFRKANPVFFTRVDDGPRYKRIRVTRDKRLGQRILVDGAENLARSNDPACGIA